MRLRFRQGLLFADHFCEATSVNRFSTLAAPRREPEASGAALAYFWAVLAGLLVPVLVVMVGLLALLLNTGGLSGPARLGTHLLIPLPKFFYQQPALMQLTGLVTLTFVVSLLFCLCVWLHRRAADNRSAASCKRCTNVY